MPAASITTSSAKAFVVRAGKFAYGVKNDSDTRVYLRHGQAVTTSGDEMGLPLEPGEFRLISFPHRLDKDLTVFGIHADSGSKTVVYEEFTFAVQAAAGGHSALAAGESVIGKTVGVTYHVTNTPVFSVGGAASTGDYVGPSTTPEAFANAVRVSNGTGVIKSITITDKLTTAAVDMELWLFSATFTAPTDNAAWDISDADRLKFLGVIELDSTRWYSDASGKVFSDDRLGLVIKPAETSLYFALVARGNTPAWASGVGGSLQISIGILED